ncbi:MAG TPA: DEAD/DEAH box helicase [Nitriliruptorales bacterium]
MTADDDRPGHEPDARPGLTADEEPAVVRTRTRTRTRAKDAADASASSGDGTSPPAEATEDREGEGSVGASGRSGRSRARQRSTSEPAQGKQDGNRSGDDDHEPDQDRTIGVPTLQLSWTREGIVAWAGGANADPESLDEVRVRLEKAGAMLGAWEERDRIGLPDGTKVDALAAPIGATLGWLVAIGASEHDPDVGASVTWLGRAATLAVRLVAQGRVAPQLVKLGTPGNGKGNRAVYGVRWTALLIDRDEHDALVAAMPGAVTATDRRRDAKKITRDVLDGVVDAICRDAAKRLEVPAPPPNPNSATDVAESILAMLDGEEFVAPTQFGDEVRKGLERWSRPVAGYARFNLVVRLNAPDSSNGWLLETLAPMGGRGRLERVEPAMSKTNDSRREIIKHEMDRLEALYDPLMRSREKRRGQVMLDQDAAWELMTEVGPRLVAAGFDVRVPPLATKKAKPGLRVTSVRDPKTGESQVGAHQLSDVRWSAVFGDEELTYDQIQELAKQQRPLVRSHGRWVEVDHADLEAAAEALAERSEQRKLTGADMLRYGLGLEDVGLSGGISVSGEGWAANLLRSARGVPVEPTSTPHGFAGELRGYQAQALAWLEFLDGAGLGGCLALDMGLGKTPTMLAHLALTQERGPALVIAPPAVVGNWASEASKFVPDLNVMVHHGQNRADEEEVAGEVADADVLITTYGTALRDIDALANITWGKVVLDEAQVIKNPNTETAVQLRRLGAHNKVVLTGTPIENGLGDLWALMDFVNPGLLGERNAFVAQLSKDTAGTGSVEQVLRTLNGVLVFRRTKADPVIASELPDRIDELDHCPMTAEQVGLYQAVLDELVVNQTAEDGDRKKGAVLAAITALKQICNHPANYTGDDRPLDSRSGKLARLEEIVENVFAADERMLIFTHFASWGERLAEHLTEKLGQDVECYHGGLARGARDRMIKRFQEGEGSGALVLSLKAGGTGLNLTAASHVVLYDRWWNPAVEDQARDRAWRIGQTRTVVAHRLVCPGTVDARVEEVVEGKRRIADLVLPKSSSVGDLDSEQLQKVLGIDLDSVLTDEAGELAGEGRA